MPKIIVCEAYRLLEHVLSHAEQQPASRWTRMPGVHHGIPVEGSETFRIYIPEMGRVEVASRLNPGAIIYSLEWSRESSRSLCNLLYAEDDPGYHRISDLYCDLNSALLVPAPAQTAALLAPVALV